MGPCFQIYLNSFISFIVIFTNKRDSFHILSGLYCELDKIIKTILIIIATQKNHLIETVLLSTIKYVLVEKTEIYQQFWSAGSASQQSLWC